MTSEKTSAVEALQDNVSQFFERFFEKYQSHMRCGKGCSSCCQDGLTVFPIEAERIFGWWIGLDASVRERIKAQWSDVLRPESTAQSCVFLSENQCTIYESRPVVCRSQGLPLKISVEKQNDGVSEIEMELSICDLNFIDGETLPDSREWLDLDRLNILLTIAQRQWNEDESTVEMIELNKKYGGRIPLSEIKALLLHKLQ